MFRYPIVLILLFSVQSVSRPLPQPRPEDEISETLAYAEALYYDARFNEAIEVLLRLDEVLQSESGKLEQKTAVKLQLAAAYTGINEKDQAKAAFRELFSLDSNYRVDPEQFSPKVITLADQARAEVNEMQCLEVWNNAQDQLQSENALELVDVLTTMKSKCPALETMEPDAAELLYRRGLESYKQDDLADALKNFREALQFFPKHELAAQYLELVQSKLQIEAERLFMDWRKSFDAHEFAPASATYHQLASINGSGAKKMVNQMNAEYRGTLSDLVESWKTACANDDAATMDMIRQTIPELLPDPLIGDDILHQMPPCKSVSCLQMDSPLALARLKRRVDPEIPPTLRNVVGLTSLTVHVKARIDEKGNVTASKAEGGNAMLNNAVRSAVGRWKFSPIVDQNGPRCVDTEIPIVIRMR